MYQYKILKLLFLSLLINYLYYYLYKNATHGICHHIFIYNGRDKNTNSQINCSIKHILNTYGGAQNKTYCNKITKIYILEYMLEYLIDEKGREIDIYNY